MVLLFSVDVLLKAKMPPPSPAVLLLTELLVSVSVAPEPL